MHRQCSPMHAGPTDPEQDGRQLPPGTTSLNQVHDRRQHRPAIDPPFPATPPTHRLHRDQRLRHLPQVIRRPPTDHILDHETKILPQIHPQPSETRL